MAVDNLLANRNAVNIRFYRPGDEEAMLRVLQESFLRWPEVETTVAPIDHLRWKLANGAHPERNHIVAEFDGEIVGVRLGIAQRYAVTGETLSGRGDVDSCVLPEWRGRGVYSSMIHTGNQITPGFDLFTTSTDRPSILELDHGLGHRPLANRLSTIVCDLTAEQGTRTDGCTIKQIERFDERIEQFWSKAARPFDFIVMPSKDELNWRYCDVRGGNGSVLQAEGRDEVIGFAAMRVSRGKGYIAYLLALPDRPDVVRDLVAESLVYFRSAGVSEAVCALPKRHPYRAALIEHGFTRKGHAVPFSCRPLRPEVDVSFLQHRKAAVHLMLGDTDLI